MDRAWSLKDQATARLSEELRFRVLESRGDNRKSRVNDSWNPFTMLSDSVGGRFVCIGVQARSENRTEIRKLREAREGMPSDFTSFNQFTPIVLRVPRFQITENRPPTPVTSRPSPP